MRDADLVPRFKPMRSGAYLKLPNPPPPHHVRTFQILYQPPGSWRIDVHNNCVCNEEISLRNRVLQATPPTSPGFARSARRVAKCIAWALGTATPMQGEWIAQYTGRKRTLYVNAQEDLIAIPFSRRDRFVKSFIKPEKVPDITRDPRTIQARSPRFNYVLGNYLKPLEHKLYNLNGAHHPMRRYFPPTRLIAKGLDLRTRARLLRQKFSRFPVCYGIDASRFDAHVSQTMLQIEHSIYLHCYHGDRFLQRILGLQLVNYGRTAQGIRYKCPGGRMSGDMNTALGNCLIMCIVVAVVMQRLGFRPNQWEMLCDGDDTLLFTTPELAPRLNGFAQQALDGGFVIKLESVSRDLDSVRFCQGSPIQTYEGWKMVQDPWRTLSRALVSVRHYQHPKPINGILGQIGLCELAINCGVPVLQEYALAMLRNAQGAVAARPTISGRFIKAQREFLAHKGQIQPLPITPEARASFELAFGIGPHDQEVLEGILRRAVF